MARDMRFGTQNVRIMYRPGSLTAVRELARYKLYIMDVLEVRWDKGGSESARGYTSFWMELFGKRVLRRILGLRGTR